MPRIEDLIESIRSGALDAQFAALYGADIAAQRARYLALAERFQARFGSSETALFSVPGRTEVTGNHTDHNRGAVLAAAINLDIIAIAAKREDHIVRLESEGFEPDEVDLGITDIVEAEKNTSAALIRGIGVRLKEIGFCSGGFNAVTTSDVLKGSGLSSSAAFEVMVGTIQNHLYNDGRIDAVTIAVLSAFAENNFFGKPSGLMDQTACSAGGFSLIDFKDPAKPVLTSIGYDFARSGYTLCATDTKSSHHDLTDEYSSMPREMKAAASCFGKDFLREVDEGEFMRNIRLVREKAGDRAALRALHFYSEHRRVLAQAEHLKRGDFEAFLATVRESGRSSFMYLQNVYAHGQVAEQAQSVSLAMTDAFLKGRGAFRVHGGGFAGITVAYVPNELVADYTAFIEPVFGKDSVKTLTIRKQGAIRLA